MRIDTVPKYIGLFVVFALLTGWGYMLVDIIFKPISVGEVPSPKPKHTWELHIPEDQKTMSFTCDNGDKYSGEIAKANETELRFMLRAFIRVTFRQDPCVGKGD